VLNEKSRLLGKYERFAPARPENVECIIHPGSTRAVGRIFQRVYAARETDVLNVIVDNRASQS
jgi:hypothetical protein